jgi:tetratricopeptide (TPR) repeat protein
MKGIGSRRAGRVSGKSAFREKGRDIMNTRLLFIILILGLTAACALPPKPVATGVSGDYNLYMSQGSNFLREKQYDRAVDVLNKAIALKPEAARAHNLLGIAYFLQENFKKAEEVFQEAVSLDKAYAAAYVNLGNTCFMMGELAKAESYLKRALSIAPNSISALYSLGTLLLSRGQYEEGTAYLAQGVALDPEYLDKQRDFTARIAVAGLSSPETYFAWAKVYAGQGRVDKAAEYLDKARSAGFKDWKRLETEKEFEKVLDDPEIIKFRRQE